MSKTTTAITLIAAQYAQGSATIEYTVPSSTRTIIDKFTATNTHTSSLALSVYIVPSGKSVGAEYLIIDALSIPDSGTTSGAVTDITELKGHVLESGDEIQVFAGTTDKIVIRASGRQVVTS